ncbi:MAG: exodeoxyribonuclease V subunit gamma [Chitinispirillales bacterium]|jgi:exodeoxyribonuclease V gamma subunit|nr:exodeoxyribonuclease V subunit gamma [Chitinispirillales bacterium]
MLNLIFAPSADRLVSLAGKLIKEIWKDPFDPPTIIVPNPAIGKWLSMRLAEGQTRQNSNDEIDIAGFGCIANARFVRLEKFLWNSLEPEPDTHLIEVKHLSQVICALLDETLLEDNIYKPLKNYLRSDGNGKIDSLKRVQLSAGIASLFLEYEYNRPSVWNETSARWSPHGIDGQWLCGKNYFQNDSAHELWQKDLYRKAYKCFSENGKRVWTTLPHLYRKKREECGKGDTLWRNTGSQLILFNVSKISHFHRNTLVEISQIDNVDMHLFLTNPCAEFWEDVDTSRKRSPKRRWSHNSPSSIAAIKPMQPDDYNKEELSAFETSQDHTLLKLWGSAGKENISLWCQQAQWNFDYHCPDLDNGAEPKTLLQSLKKSLLLRDDNLETQKCDLKNDRSLQILACPDRSREVEELREIVLDMVYNRAIVKFNDIAVYMPDPNIYLPHIQSVFGAYSQNDTEYIPFTMLNASGASSMVSQGISSLLNIIGGKFDRPQIFALLKNPIVQASRNFSPDMVTVWERWARDLGMFRGYNASGRKSMGDKGEAVNDAHTFKQGLSRILTGNLAAGPVNLGYSSGGSAGEPLLTHPYRDIDASDEALAEIFCGLLEQLNELTAQFTKNGYLLDIKETVELIKKAVWFWLCDIPDNEQIKSGAEESVRQELIEGLDLITLQQTLAGRNSISLEEFTALVRTCLPQELPSTSFAWNGITFAPLRTSMIAPHRVIFVLGLDASAFPGTNGKGSWDLLSQKRIIGDSDKVRDNRFAFLELLHAAKERMILSYRARDMQKDELLGPSSVVLELEDYLVSQGLTEVRDGRTRCCVRREIPWVVHESLDMAINNGRKHGTWNKTQYMLAMQYTNARDAHRHDIALAKPVPAQKSKICYSTNLSDLKRFFSNPLEYHLYRTLGAGANESGTDLFTADEPLDSGYISARLRKNVWVAVLEMLFPVENSMAVKESELESIAVSEAEKIYANHIASGFAPQGYLCRMEKQWLLKWTKKCVEAAKALPLSYPDHKLVKICDFSLGRKNMALPINITDESGCSFSVSGAHPLALIPRNFENGNEAAALIAFDKNGNPGDNHELWLGGAAQWFYETSRGKFNLKKSIGLMLLNHYDPKVQISQMKMNLERSNDIKKWLTAILRQMLIENRCEHLPFKVIQEITKPDKEHSNFSESLQKLTADTLKNKLREGKYYKCHMEAFDLTDARQPQNLSDTELQKLADSRFAPMLARWIHE